MTIFFVFEGEIRCYFLFCANNAKTLSLRYTFVAHCVFLFLTVIAVFSFSPECTVADYLPLCPVSYVKHSSLRSSLLSFLFCIYVCTIVHTAGLGIHSFQKNGAIFAFFSVLYKRTKWPLRSFPFFIKERNDLCVLFHSL